MEFGYIVQLRLAQQRAVVVGGGPVAAGRVRDLLGAGADVTVVTPAPGDEVTAVLAANDDRANLVRRPYQRGDLTAAALAVVTGEDDTDVDTLWAESRESCTLTSVLDDLPHCDFAAPAQVRRGDLGVTVSTGGTAPALAKRLRRHLEDEVLGPEWETLVDAVGAAREQALPRTVSFEEWAGRWEDALADLPTLAQLAAAGDTDAIVDHVLAHVTAGAAPAASDDEPCASTTQRAPTNAAGVAPTPPTATDPRKASV